MVLKKKENIPLITKYTCTLQGKIWHFVPEYNSWKCINKGTEASYKPVIYLYPTKKQDVEVRLDYKGEIFADYPEYDEEIKGWKVLAYPDGKLINYADDKEYSYLFWEGRSSEEIECYQLVL